MRTPAAGRLTLMQQVCCCLSSQKNQILSLASRALGTKAFLVENSPALGGCRRARLVDSDRQLRLVLSPAVWLYALARAIDVVLGSILASHQLCLWSLRPFSPAKVTAPLAQAMSVDRIDAGLGAKRLCGLKLD